MTRLTVNGEAVRYRLDPATPLLFALRDASNLTGTKYGCDSGDCGACTVIVDGQAVMSCRVAIGDLEGAQVTTIEGLSGGGAHPVQQAWLDVQAVMCGYCQPGFVMAVAALVQSGADPTEQQVNALPNLCRCGGYPRIRQAIERAGAKAAAARQAQQTGPETIKPPLRSPGAA